VFLDLLYPSMEVKEHQLFCYLAIALCISPFDHGNSGKEITEHIMEQEELRGRDLTKTWSQKHM